ncbi:RDD family protein [Microbacterium sp. HJ5]
MTPRPPLAVTSASLGRRAAAYAIDVAVASGVGLTSAGVTLGIAFGLGAAGAPGTLTLAFVLAATAGWATLLVWTLVYTAMQGGGGSVGQRALDLRVLDATAPVSIGFWRALWRNVVWALSCAIVVGWFTPLFDASPRRRGWHDRAAGALVLVEQRVTDAASRAARPARVPAPAPGTFAAPPAPVAPSRPAIEPQPWFLDRPAPALAPAPAPAPALTLPAPARAPIVPVTAPVTPAPAAVSPAAAGAVAASPAAAVAVAEASASPVEALPHAPATRPFALTGLDVTRTTVPLPPPAQRAALFDDAPVLAVLTWDDGTRMAVYGRTRYGRNPAVEPGIVSVPVRDETLSLSKTHFEIGGGAQGAWVVDRHSTNGTVLVRDGVRHPLVAGVATALRRGDTLELGDRSLSVGGA